MTSRHNNHPMYMERPTGHGQGRLMRSLSWSHFALHDLYFLPDSGRRNSTETVVTDRSWYSDVPPTDDVPFGNSVSGTSSSSTCQPDPVTPDQDCPARLPFRQSDQNCLIARESFEGDRITLNFAGQSKPGCVMHQNVKDRREKSSNIGNEGGEESQRKKADKKVQGEPPTVLVDSDCDAGEGVLDGKCSEFDCRFTIVDSEQTLTDALDKFERQPVYPPALYLDVKGRRLGRDGDISLLTVFVAPDKEAYLIDFVALGPIDVFDISSRSGETSIKSLLQSNYIPKVLFDVRSPCDALFNLFTVSPRCLYDLQLMEWSTRRGPRKYVKGLSKCVEEDGGMSSAAYESWRAVKSSTRAQFNPADDESDGLLHERPVSHSLLLHCIMDVIHLRRLWSVYDGRQQSNARSLVAHETTERVRLVQSPEYVGQGTHMAIAPKISRSKNMPFVTTNDRAKKKVGRKVNKTTLESG